MAGNRPRFKKIRCFSFRRKRNIFDYVDDPSQANVDDLGEPVLDHTVKSSVASKHDDIRSDTTEDRDEVKDDKTKYEGYDPHVTNYNPPKEKFFKKKPSSRGKIKTPRSAVPETSNLTKPRDDHVGSEPNYLGYGMVDLPKDFRKLSTTQLDKLPTKEALNYHSFKRDDSGVYREIVGGGSKFLIGGKLSDGKPSIESRVWDMVERRGWGMLHGNWNVMAPKVFNKVVEFLTGMEISLCRQVSKGWYKNVTDVMVMRSEVIVEAFKKTYLEKLEYDRSYILFQPVLTATKSLRIDVIIRAKVEPYCTMSKNSFGYTYSYQSHTNTMDSKDTTPKGNESYRSKESGREGLGLFNRKSSKSVSKTLSNSNNKVSKKPTFISKFIFEVLKKNSPRTITFTRDLSSMHRDDMNLAASASVYQICEGDFIEVPITLINAIGSTDVNSVTFLPLVRDVLSNAPSQLDLLHREWYTVEPNSKYLEQLFPQNIHSYSIIHPHKLLPQLVHQVTQVAGIDVITSKSSYVASHLGFVLESRNIIGHTVEVVPKTDCVICMIHRLGLQHDRICHVQLRPGDVLQLYLTKG